MVVVGNTTMRDLFFGFDVQSVGQQPYKSVVEHEYRAGARQTTALNVKAAKLGIRIHPEANVYGRPLLGAHVGAATAGDVRALALDLQSGPVLLGDIGTNNEVVVGHNGPMLAASCPAGPAFEGGEVKFGMPAYDGAVEKVRISCGGGTEYETINHAPAR